MRKLVEMQYWYVVWLSLCSLSLSLHIYICVCYMLYIYIIIYTHIGVILTDKPEWCFKLALNFKNLQTGVILSQLTKNPLTCYRPAPNRRWCNMAMTNGPMAEVCTTFMVLYGPSILLFRIIPACIKPNHVYVCILWIDRMTDRQTDR